MTSDQRAATKGIVARDVEGLSLVEKVSGTLAAVQLIGRWGSNAGVGSYLEGTAHLKWAHETKPMMSDARKAIAVLKHLAWWSAMDWAEYMAQVVVEKKMTFGPKKASQQEENQEVPFVLEAENPNRVDEPVIEKVAKARVLTNTEATRGCTFPNDGQYRYKPKKKEGQLWTWSPVICWAWRSMKRSNRRCTTNGHRAMGLHMCLRWAVRRRQLCRWSRCRPDKEASQRWRSDEDDPDVTRGHTLNSLEQRRTSSQTHGKRKRWQQPRIC